MSSPFTHLHTVQSQFDPQAQAYLTSHVHAHGPDLAHAQALVAQALPAGTGQVLDLGCGAGHLSFALAPQVARVIAVDPSPQMLATVRQAAAARGLAQIDTCEAPAEALPLADASIDLVATRYSAHHWTRLDAALQEMHRVLKPGGHVLVIDVEGEADALVDTHLQAMELLRDRSHVRNRSAGDWQALLASAGFQLLEHRRWPLRLDFTSWVARMRTPAGQVEAIRALQRGAPREVVEALRIEPDGSFTVGTGVWWGRA
jgi:ubiquinone/menaquinone biosynthesis C-methylase UbiE